MSKYNLDAYFNRLYEKTKPRLAYKGGTRAETEAWQLLLRQNVSDALGLHIYGEAGFEVKANSLGVTE